LNQNQNVNRLKIFCKYATIQKSGNPTDLSVYAITSFIKMVITPPEPRLTPTSGKRSKDSASTRLRLRIAAADAIGLAQALEGINACCHVSVQSAPAQLQRRSVLAYAVDLDLRGSLAEIQQALRHLQAFPLRIQGRANPDGDGWYC
jgi:hypothetical protein